MNSKSNHTSEGSIVVGTDGSASGEHALLWAAEQAHLEHRSLMIVHAIGAQSMAWSGGYGVDMGVMREALESEGRAVLDRAVDAVRLKFPDLEIHDTLPFSDPRQALLDLSTGATMVVVGSRGLGPVGRLVLGSVSVAVSRHASCPVVVIRPHNPGTVRNGVLVGVDATAGSRETVEFAYREASQRSLPLTVMHCFFDTLAKPVARAMPYDTPGFEERRLIVDQAVSGMGEKFPDVHVTLTLARGLVDECLLRASSGMDMIVVGRDPSRGIFRFFAPEVDRALVEHAVSIVAVVPESFTQEH